MEKVHVLRLLAAMTQRNLSTNTTRSVRRLLQWSGQIVQREERYLHVFLINCLVSILIGVYNTANIGWSRDAHRFSVHFKIKIWVYFLTRYSISLIKSMFSYIILGFYNFHVKIPKLSVLPNLLFKYKVKWWQIVMLSFKSRSFKNIWMWM